MIVGEVLRQYFFVVDPSRIDDVPDLVRKHKNSIEDLCNTLQTEYGLNPLKPLTCKEVKEWKKMKHGIIMMLLWAHIRMHHPFPPNP